MKGLQKELKNRYRSFTIKRGRDGDFVMSKRFDLGKIEIAVIFDSQDYNWFRISGIIRFDNVEQLLEPYIYDMNPAYLKNTMTIGCSSWASNRFEKFQEVQLSNIFNTTDFILDQLEKINSLEILAKIMDDKEFKISNTNLYSYRIVKSEMRRIAVSKLLNDKNLKEIIIEQLRDVETYTFKDDLIYRGLNDLVKSLGYR